MNRKIIGYYSISIGLAVLLMWTMILLNENIPEGKIEISYHLFSEFLMAIICIISGILVLVNAKIGRLLNILGLGMVFYSVLNAAGYYGERDNILMTVMFSAVFIFTAIVVFMNLRAK